MRLRRQPDGRAPVIESIFVLISLNPYWINFVEGWPLLDSVVSSSLATIEVGPLIVTIVASPGNHSPAPVG